MAAFNFDGIAQQPYDGALYKPETVMPPIQGLGAWDANVDEEYRALGFVSVEDAFSNEEIQGFCQAILDMLADGGLPPGVELQYEADGRGKVEVASPEERMNFVRKFMWFTKKDARTLALAMKPELLQVVSRLLGGEPELYQDMALLKPPGIGREKPWHQDHAYFNVPEGTPIVGVWIALDDATVENGGMVFLPGSHREGPIPHFNRRDWQICDAEILARQGQVAAPIKAGGCLIFDGLTAHGTPANRSGARRRAGQFHFIRKDTLRTTSEDRIALFGSEGRNVSC